ncbi:MAG: hypothetical protein ACI9FB_003755 [Candidatus Azotimanducaceae bacterium]
MNGEVLSTDTGYKRNYQKSVYPGYQKSKRLWFKVVNKARKECHPKERALGVEVSGVYKAYHFVELVKLSSIGSSDKGRTTLSISDAIGGKRIIIFKSRR